MDACKVAHTHKLSGYQRRHQWSILFRKLTYWPLIRCVKLRVAHAPGTVFPPRNSDPDMHHGTCVTNVPWCTPGSLTSGFLWSRWRENVPGIPGACATRNFTYLLRGPCFAELPLKFNCCSVKHGWMFLIKKGHWPVSWTHTPALSD